MSPAETAKVSRMYARKPPARAVSHVIALQDVTRPPERARAKPREHPRAVGSGQTTGESVAPKEYLA